MLEKAYTILYKNMVRTDGVSFSKLVTALRTAAISPNNLNYYKEKTSYSDVLDAFLQLSLILQQPKG
jgi:hypothetical protein